MNQELFDWILLLLRWLHIAVAIAWIGASIFFMWLDRTFTPNPGSSSAGHVGELWMIHGGGFYKVEKLLMGPTKVPERLHWFKWESYWTWMSGFALLVLIFYTSGGTFLLDSSVSDLTYGQALSLGLGSLIGSWFFYDFLWERKLTHDQPLVGHALTLAWFAGMSYFLCQQMSGRAAYIHIGAMLGTWMTANVFLRIIPRQVKMVEAAKRGESVNPDWGKNAKNRSTHNTYFTLPVIFIMLSNHFPSTYGNRLNWLVLLFMSAAGAAIREYFVARLHRPARARAFAVLGGVIVLGLMLFTRENVSSTELSSGGGAAAVGAPVDPGQVRIKGIVEFSGRAPDPVKLQLPYGCDTGGKDVYSNEVMIQDGRLQNALIRVIKGLEGKTFSDVPPNPVVVDQKGCLYVPRVSAARVGQRVDFLNSDPIFHNVKSISAQNENFNIGMPNKNDRASRVFTKPEIFLQTKCSVHPWMGAYIAVMDHPYFGVTDAKGEFAISGLPDGTYTLEAWHEVFGTQTREITLKRGKTARVDFEFER